MAEPSDHGFLFRVVDRVLRFMDKPWKAIVVIVLIAMLSVGWIAYEKRDELIEAWLTPTSPELKTAEVPEALEKLIKDTDADLVQIWSVDLSANAQWFLGARRHDGERPVIPSPRRLPIIVHASDVRVLIDVMEGHPSCIDLEKIGSPLARRLAERGMKRGCAIPIPPNPDSFVGVIYLAWTSDNLPDPSQEGVMVAVAREVARKLATH